MQTIVTACPQLTELHLSPAERCDDGDMTGLLRVLAIAQGKLRTLRIKATISEERVRSLGETNHDLQTLSAEILPDNIAALTPLLATHCRKLRTLDLSFFNSYNNEHEQQRFRSEGWRRFPQAVQSASTDLREVAVEWDKDRGPSGLDVSDLVDAIASVLESLNDRARTVRFVVPASVIGYTVMIAILCWLLDVATRKCRNLEILKIRLGVGDFDHIWDNEEELKINSGSC